MGEASPRARGPALKKPTHHDITVAGETLRLLPDHALFWPRKKILCFSDVHLGKAESLQGLGLPIPSGSHMTDLGRIATLLRETGAERVLILGDLIHAKRGLTDEIMETLQKFFAFFPNTRFELLMGNHERGAMKLLSSLPLLVTEGDLIEAPFRFSHGHDKDGGFGAAGSGPSAGPGAEAANAGSVPKTGAAEAGVANEASGNHDTESAKAGADPNKSAGGDASDLFTIQGHVHPVVVIKEGSTRLRLPCFWMTAKSLTLPSFGVLTGGWVVKPTRRDQIFATTGQQILPL